MSDNLQRIPPQNLEAEESLLGSILIDKDAILKISDLVRAEDFYHEAHGKIFEAMLELFQKREPIDLLSLDNKLKEKKQLEAVGGRSALASLSNAVPTASHVEHYAEIVVRKAMLRRMIGAASDITKLGYDGGDDVEALINEAEKRMFEVSKKHLKRTFVPIQNVLDGAYERIEELHREKGKLRGISTGFHELDNVLAGLQKSDLVILAARPSVGKTTLAMDIARLAAKKSKIPVGVFSLEMSKEQLVDRMICSEAGIDLWKMRTGNLTDSNDFSRIAQALSTLSESPIYIDDSPNANIMQIRSKARRLQMETGLGLIVIDYLQLMESRGKSENRVQEVSEITRALKGLARELDIPVLALSQLARAVEMSKPAIPKLAHLRESGCLTGDTLILRADTGQQIPIKNLVGKTNIPVITMDSNFKLKTSKASKIFTTGYKQTFEILLQSGKKIKATKNHKFYTVLGWKRLDELTPKTRLAVPRELYLNLNSKMSDNKIIVLAHLIGDGCYVKKQPLHYTSADMASLRAVQKSAVEDFGIRPRLVPQKNWFHLYLGAPQQLTHGKRNPIVKWLDEDLKIYGQRSKEKMVPDIIFTLSNKKIALFLKHLWSTDGNFSKATNRGWSIYYATKSHKLAQDVQHLLLRLGILSRIKEHKDPGYSNGFIVVVSGRDQQLIFLKKVGIFGKKSKFFQKASLELKNTQTNPNLDIIPKEAWKIIDNARKLKGLSWREFTSKYGMSYCGSTLLKHGISHKRLKRILTFLPDKTLEKLCNSDLYWDEIVSIKPKKVEAVYDLTVPQSHNFVSNDIIVHNSIEQDADVVLFIYRKTADRNYNIDEIPPEERSIAEVHIAKHRNGPTGMVKLFFDEERVTFRSLDRQHTAGPGIGTEFGSAGMPPF